MSFTLKIANNLLRNSLNQNVLKRFANNKNFALNKQNSYIFNTKIRHMSSAANNTVTVYFVDRDGEKKEAKAKLGTNLLDVAIDNNIDLEGFGACEGTLSCSTCHLILNKEDFAQLKPPSDEENDMLDLAYGLTDSSRLGCQVIVNEKMNGWVFVVPKEVADARN